VFSLPQNRRACDDALQEIPAQRPSARRPSTPHERPSERSLDADVVGASEIYDRFSLVDVPDEIADDIVDALRATHIEGKQVPIRRDKDVVA
jgi:hypothetical protein